MPNDSADHALYQRIGQAIQDVRGDMTQTQLADLIGARQATVSDYEVARAKVPLHVIRLIEEACEVRRGTIFYKAGLVDRPDTETVLGSDPELEPEDRAMFVRFYRRVKANPLGGDG